MEKESKKAEEVLTEKEIELLLAELEKLFKEKGKLKTE